MSGDTEVRTVRLARPALLAGALLVTLAYVPALTSKPGRMPADSKLYLYLDPGRFLADAAGTFDPRQFAGWVPHQHVAYLWPTGPWYWVFDLVGVPDWIAHRLWIGTLFVAAGLGARACARLLGFGQLAALTAAVVYQLSPYVLPYVSRTSVMLLPWAGLGWILVFTIRATRRTGWGDPAAVALVVATVGAVNATALAMIVPAPVLWLVHEGWRRSIEWRRALLTALQIGALALGVSLWWIAMLVVQGRSGVDVLPYSESLADVSFTSTAPEAWRGLGYWLFYVRDPYAATTTESLRYLSSTLAIGVSYLVAIIGLAGLVWTRWPHRRFASLLVVTGLVLAVGVHPIDDRSPLMQLLTGGGDGGVALALRSSTRALPLLAIGLALGAGSLVSAIPDLVRVGAARRRIRVGVAGLVVALAVVNVPGHWRGALVDPALERDEDPPDAWLAAADDLDRTADPSDRRVLQVPGAEFGAYRWGYTVDQPLPGLTERPLVTRDLLPLGSPAAMDLLFAFDDRVQDGVLEPPALAPISRLLGVGTVWLTNDHAADRFRTARPEVVRDLVAGAPGIGDVESYGEPRVNVPDVAHTDGRALADPRVGRPLPPVELAELTDPGAIVRATDRTVVVSGSGDGLVDAAASGLLGGDAAVAYSADLGATLAGELDRAAALIVTDSNRAQARHWRSSQDTRGFTEHRDESLDPLADVAGDARLPLFDTDEPATRSWAEQIGPVTAAATSYGEPFAYLPEHRPVMAIDGDPRTAWIVGEHGDPLGERIVLTAVDALGQITLRQPADTGSRRITEVEILTGDTAGVGSPTTHRLDDRSVSPDGQAIDLARPATRVEIVIRGVGGGTPGTAGAVAGVGFVEIGHALGPTREVVTPPTDALGEVPSDLPLAIALTRWRTDPMDRWRDDPEPVLRRSFSLPGARTFAVEPTVRVDARASDAELAAVFGWPVTASTRLTGSPRNAGVAAFDGDDATSWITGFGETVGASLRIDDVAEPIGEITVRQAVGEFSRVSTLELRSGGEARTIALAPDVAGRSTVEVRPPLPPGPMEIEITGVEPATTVDRRHGDVVELPAAIATIDVGATPLVDDVVADVELECVPVATIDGAQVRASVRISGTAWLDGDPVTTVPCGGSVELAAGPHTVGPVESSLPFQLDRLVLDDGARDALAGDPDRATGAASAEVVERSRYARSVRVTDCPAGCWLVVGEGFNESWSAAVDGTDLGPPRLIDGGFNGWWITTQGDPVVVDVRWNAQRPLTIAMIVSLVVALLAAALVVLERRLRSRATSVERDEPRPRWTWAGSATTTGWRHRIGSAVLWVAAAGVLIAPVWGLVGAVAGAAALLPRRRIAELTAWATLVAVGAAVAWLERRNSPFPNGGWPAEFESLHRIGMFAAVALLVGAVFADDADPDGYPRSP